MTYADILIHVNGSEQSKKAFEIGIELGRLFKSHLSASYPLQPFSLLPYTGMAIDAAVVSEIHNELAQEAEAFGKQLTKIANDNLVKLDWNIPEGQPEEIITAAGRIVDLVVLSQGDPQKHQADILGLSNDIIIRLGRPCLIVPFIECCKPPFKRILVAWDGGQPAARALNDAIPFMKLADHVEVTTVYEARKGSINTSNKNENICEHLLRHGISAQSTSLPSKDVDVANTLLNHISDTGADLLVSGGYGHSRLREIVLGGVTRSLLNTMTVPVLMSH